MLTACQKKQNQSIPITSQELKRLNKIESRLNKIELKIKNNLKKIGKEDIKTPSGPIKSLTFRIGSRDDRLRIYWADGTNSDLPCMKEQSLWVCG